MQLKIIAVLKPDLQKNFNSSYMVKIKLLKGMFQKAYTTKQKYCVALNINFASKLVSLSPCKNSCAFSHFNFYSDWYNVITSFYSYTLGIHHNPISTS